MKNEKKITEEMTFKEVMQIKPKAGIELMQMGLMCAGCPMAQIETVRQGCEAHGMDPKKVVKKLNNEEEE